MWKRSKTDKRARPLGPPLGPSSRSETKSSRDRPIASNTSGAEKIVETDGEVSRKRLKCAPSPYRFNPMAILGPERSCVIPFGAMDFRSKAEATDVAQGERLSTGSALRACRELISVSAERDFLHGLKRLYKYKGSVEALIDMDRRVFRGLMLATAVFNPDLTIPQPDDVVEPTVEPTVVENLSTSSVPNA